MENKEPVTMTMDPKEIDQVREVALSGRYKSIEIDHRKLIDYSILLDNTR